MTIVYKSKLKPPKHMVMGFFSFSPEFSIKERRNNFRTLQTSRAAVLTYLDWLVPLKFLFGFDNEVACLIM